MTKPLAPSNKLQIKTEISAKARQKWQPLALVDDDATAINVLDEIGDDYWSDSDVTVERVMAKLKLAAGADVVVNINSYGGAMFEGLAIYNLLVQYEGAVKVRILGVAASAASIIAMAGDSIEMSPASFLMIHNAWVWAAGNRHDFAELAQSLQPFDDAMAGIYVAQTGLNKAKIAEMMDAETWINGDEAIAQGFASGLFEVNVQASANKSVNALREVDTLLAKQGLPRNERRELLNQIKGTQDAAQSGMQDAAWQEKMQLQAGIMALNLKLNN